MSSATAKLTVSGRFALDPAHNPPPAKRPSLDPDGSSSVQLGPGIELHLPTGHVSEFNALLDARVAVDAAGFTGLGSVHGGCPVICISSTCANWALRNGRPRTVAKVVGVMIGEPWYVLLSQPRLSGSQRARRESGANRRDAGLVPFVLINPGEVVCPSCSDSIGNVTVVD